MSDDNLVFDDIANAFYRLRSAFIKNGLKPPKSIELADYRDGDLFRHAIREMILYHPRMGETKRDSEWICDLMGIEVRMPASWRVGPDGKPVLSDPVFYPLSDFMKDDKP